MDYNRFRTAYTPNQIFKASAGVEKDLLVQQANRPAKIRAFFKKVFIAAGKMVRIYEEFLNACAN